MIVIRQGWAWNHAVEAILGLENCPRKLGRSLSQTATNSRLVSMLASASSPGQVVGNCCSLLSKYHP